MAEQESRELMQDIMQRGTSGATYSYAHAWRRGDVVLWCAHKLQA